MTIPLGIHCFCFITTLQERQQYLIRCVGGPNNIIWQKELSHSCMIERLWWLNRIVLESLRFRIGISIENWFIDRTSAWPETTTTSWEYASTATKRAIFGAPGCKGAVRPEKRVTARSKACLLYTSPSPRD